MTTRRVIVDVIIATLGAIITVTPFIIALFTLS
jgi:hypothetical protein